MPQNKTKFEKLGGFQNYLNKPDRSGLDPVDTSRTAAGIEGFFLKRLFTLTLKTRNIVQLVMMLLFGISATGFGGFALYAMALTPLVKKLDFTGFLALAGFYLIVGLIFCIGCALLINFVINIGIVLGFVKRQSGNTQWHRPEERKKKLPKRRKDFR